MNKLAHHADWYRTCKARMRCVTHRHDGRTDSRFKPSSKTKRNKRASRNVELLPSDSDIHTTDHAKVVLPQDKANSRTSTIPTPYDLSILDSGPYCRVCLQSNLATSACPYLKNPVELAQIRTREVKRMFSPKMDKHLRSSNNRRRSPKNLPRSPNCSDGRNHSRQLAPRDQNQSTTYP